MAQVIRKFLDGGKPLVVNKGSKLFDYNALELAVWYNFDDYAKHHEWSNDTTTVTRQALSQVMDGIKNGTITMNPDGSLNVPGELASDGKFNVAGKSIFSHLVLNDTKAGRIFATNFLNELTNHTPSYRAPEKKKIGNIPYNVLKKIRDDNFSGSQEAFEESWNRMSEDSRKQLLAGALQALDYNADEYDGVDNFTKYRDSFMTALTSGDKDALNNAWNAMGGVGLDALLTGSSTKSLELTAAKTMEDLRKEWREEAVNAGYIGEDQIGAYTQIKEREYTEAHDAVSQLKALNYASSLEGVVDAYGLYGKLKKGEWYKRYGTTALTVHLPDNWKPSSITKLNSTVLRLKQKDIYNKFRSGQTKGLGQDLISLADMYAQGNLLQGSGQWKVMPESEDYANQTVIAYNPNSNQFRTMSMWDFNDIYDGHLTKTFVDIYNKNHPDNPITDSFLVDYSSLNAPVPSQKQGGVLKAQEGLKFLQEQAYRTSGQATTAAANPLMDFYRNRDEQIRQEKAAHIEEAKQAGFDDVNEYDKYLAEQLKKEKAKLDKIKHKNTKVKDIKDLDNDDWLRISGAALDVVGTIGSLTGGAFNPVTWVGSLGSLGAYTVADWNDDSVSAWDMAKNFGINLGLSVASGIPEVGAAAPMIRLGKLAIHYGPALLTLLNNTPKAYDAMKKVVNGENITALEWVDIANGFRALGVGTRAGFNLRNSVRYTTKGEGKYQVKTDKGWQDVSKATYDKLKEAKASDLKTLHPARNPLTDINGRALGIIQTERSIRNIKSYNPFSSTSRAANRRIQTRTTNGGRRVLTSDEYIAKFGQNPGRSFMNYVNDTQRMLNFSSHMPNLLNDTQRMLNFSSHMPNLLNDIFSGKKTTIQGVSITNKINLPQKFQESLLYNVMLKHKSGGSIEKFQGGGFTNVSNDGYGTWRDIVFDRYKADLYDLLKKTTDPKQRLELIKSINDYQTTHHELYNKYSKDGKLLDKIGYDEAVKNLQLGINDKYGFVNSKGIENGWLTGRYTTTSKNRRLNGDGLLNSDGSYTFTPDGFFGGLTDDRRILGRRGDFSDTNLKYYNSDLKKLGLEMYEGENGYYYLRELTSGDSTGYPTKAKEEVESLAKSELGEQDPDGKSKALKWYEKAVETIDPTALMSFKDYLDAQKTNREITQNAKDHLTVVPHENPTINEIVRGDYLTQKAAQLTIGELNASANRTQSSDAYLNRAQGLEAAYKANFVAMKAAEDVRSAYNTTTNKVNAAANQNAVYRVDEGNQNRQRVAAYNNAIGQLENAEKQKAYENKSALIQSLITDMKQSSILGTKARQDAWANSINEKYNKLEDQYNDLLKTLRNEAKQKYLEAHNNDITGFTTEFYNSDEYKALAAKMRDLPNDKNKELAEGNVYWYSQIPGLKVATPPFLKSEYLWHMKDGGHLSYSDRQMLKATTEIGKNMRSSERNRSSERIADKKRSSEQTKLISQHTADLIMVALGVKK